MSIIDNKNNIVSVIIDAYKSGRCVAWIRNTVGEALEAYNEVRLSVDKENIMLFHSKFIMSDRIDIEKKVCEKFGKNSSSKERKGQILISTQVIEQSLDLDFDVMITDLAPIDLIIQRLGRMQRHIRNKKGDRYNENGLLITNEERDNPTLYVHAPKWTEKPNNNWYKDFSDKSEYVYQKTYLLYLTLSILREGSLVLPDNARHYIEFVHNEDNIPETLRAKERNNYGKECADRTIAKANMVDLSNGYENTVRWGEEKNVITRLSKQNQDIYIALNNNGKIESFAKTEKYNWEYSRIAVDVFSKKNNDNYSLWESQLGSVLSNKELVLDNKDIISLMKDKTVVFLEEDDSFSDCGEKLYKGVLSNKNDKRCFSYSRATGFKFS